MTKKTEMVIMGPNKFILVTKDNDRKPVYEGPVIEITGDKTWIYVNGGYESKAMINREALPLLIKALQKLDKHLKSL